MSEDITTALPENVTLVDSDALQNKLRLLSAAMNTLTYLAHTYPNGVIEVTAAEFQRVIDKQVAFHVSEEGDIRVEALEFTPPKPPILVS